MNQIWSFCFLVFQSASKRKSIFRATVDLNMTDIFNDYFVETRPVVFGIQARQLHCIP